MTRLLFVLVTLASGAGWAQGECSPYDKPRSGGGSGDSYAFTGGSTGVTKYDLS